jgi:hypothetical protein
LHNGCFRPLAPASSYARPGGRRDFKAGKGRNGLRVTERQRLGAKLDPALRDFVDRVIVPALVREYIAEHGTPNQLADSARGVRQFEPKKRLSAEGIQ